MKNVLRIICVLVMVLSIVGFNYYAELTEVYPFIFDSTGSHVPKNGASGVSTANLSCAMTFSISLFSWVYLECNFKK